MPHRYGNSHAAWDHTQCYLPPDRGDIPALTPAEAGTRLSDPEGCKAESTYCCLRLSSSTPFRFDARAARSTDPSRHRRRPPLATAQSPQLLAFEQVYHLTSSRRRLFPVSPRSFPVFRRPLLVPVYPLPASRLLFPVSRRPLPVPVRRRRARRCAPRRPAFKRRL